MEHPRFPYERVFKVIVETYANDEQTAIVCEMCEKGGPDHHVCMYFTAFGVPSDWNGPTNGRTDERINLLGALLRREVRMRLVSSMLNFRCRGRGDSPRAAFPYD